MLCSQRWDGSPRAGWQRPRHGSSVSEQRRMEQRGHPQPPPGSTCTGTAPDTAGVTQRQVCQEGPDSLMLKKSRAFMQRNSCGVICSQPNSWERCRILTHWLYMRDLCMRYLGGETRQARLEVTAPWGRTRGTPAAAGRCAGGGPVCNRGGQLGLQAFCDPLLSQTGCSESPNPAVREGQS